MKHWCLKKPHIAALKSENSHGGEVTVRWFMWDFLQTERRIKFNEWRTAAPPHQRAPQTLTNPLTLLPLFSLCFTGSVECLRPFYPRLCLLWRGKKRNWWRFGGQIIKQKTDGKPQNMRLQELNVKREFGSGFLISIQVSHEFSLDLFERVVWGSNLNSRSTY